jgi:hypothetical protein
MGIFGKDATGGHVMPKFVLIDPSLQALGGHHFEYALHLLRAAEQVGFEPWLGSHRKFRDRAELPKHWQILPLYQRGTYSKRRILADDGSSANPRNRAWAVRWFAEWWNDRRRAKRASAFARDTAALFRQLTLGPGDQVFLPTVSELELFGLAQFLAHDDRGAGADWHLQFHFPIYAGYEPDYPAQDASLERLRRGFRQALALAGEHRLHLYTTTEGLAVQYNRLGVAQFQSLPYPGNPTLQSCRARSMTHGGPLRVTYLGDARHEKGYQLLPQIIDRVWAEHVATNRIRFVIQSDCHFPQPPQGNNIAVFESRAALGQLPPEKITLLDAPLDSEEFCRQTLHSDIGLLPYERTSYSVRCSGILVDLLAVGVPVVVPAGSWLADQLAESTRDYHVGLRHGQRVCSRATARPGSRVAVPAGTSDLVLFLRWPVDLKLCSGAYASVVATYWGHDAVRLGIWPTVVGPGRPDRLSTALVRLPPGTESVTLDWRNAYGPQPLDFREVEVCFLAADADRQTPRGAVGLVAADAGQFPELLADIVEHYPHYRQTAASLARRWSEWNNPARVVSELLSQRPSIPLPGSNLAPPRGPARRAIRR